MRLGKKKQTAAYRAIHEAVVSLRIELNRDGLSAKHDAMIAQVETRIWSDVVAALESDSRLK